MSLYLDHELNALHAMVEKAMSPHLKVPVRVGNCQTEFRRGEHVELCEQRSIGLCANCERELCKTCSLACHGQVWCLEGCAEDHVDGHNYR